MLFRSYANQAFAADPDLMVSSNFSSSSSLGITDFSGVNLGVDVGAGLGSAGQVNTSGLIGGAHIGYHFQSSRLMGGTEADVLTSGIKSGSLSTLTFQQKFLSSLRVKAGWVFGDLLAYGTLGYAYSTSSLSTNTGSDNKTNKGTVFGALIEAIDLSQLARLDAEAAREEIRDIVNEIITIKNVVMSIAEQEQLLTDICNDVLGYGPLEPLLARDDIADIMVNGASRVFIEVAGKVQLTNVRFRDNAQLMNICQRIVSQVGRRVDESSPICDARLPDG